MPHGRRILVVEHHKQKTLYSSLVKDRTAPVTLSLVVKAGHIPFDEVPPECVSSPQMNSFRGPFAAS